jgi:hypothetical protein
MKSALSGSDDVKRLRRRRADSPAPARRFAPADVRTTLEALQQRPRALRLEVRPPSPLPPPSRTNWTRLVPPSVLTGRAGGLVLRTYPLALFSPLNQG